MPYLNLRQVDVAKLDTRVVERVEEALLRALRFLTEDARVFHRDFLPVGHHGLVVLAMFFDHNPQPVQRTRDLLARWWWRSANGFEQLDAHKMGLQAQMMTDDEYESVELLLAKVQMPILRVSPSTRWRPDGFTLETLGGLALVNLGPRDPENGDVITIDQIRTWLSQGTLEEVFLDVEGLVESTLARRFVLPDYEKIDKLATASDVVLTSHGLDREAAEALGRRDIAACVERRSRILEPYFKRFFAARLGADDDDRPPIAELIRRADRKLKAS
jgi:hypothetical protein